MGVRFRKSFKIAPGVKFNLNKKSVGLTFGGKGVHYTVNSSGRKTSTVGIPGTGLSYTHSSGGGNKTNISDKKQSGGNSNFFNRIVSFFTSKGCLGYLLGLIAAMIAISVVFVILILVSSFLWIPSIVAAIFFFVKKDKKKGIIFSCITVLSIIAMLFFMSQGNSTDNSSNKNNVVSPSAINIETESPKPSVTPEDTQTEKPSEEPTSTVESTPTTEPTQTVNPTPAPTTEPTQEPVAQETEQPQEQIQQVQEQQTESNNWVLNTSSNKIHYPSCSDVKKIKPDNYATSDSSLDELLAEGYSKCGHCFK